MYSTITNLVLLPLIWIQANEKEMAKRIESPLDYFQVSRSHEVVGEDSFPIHKVKRVAIDVQEDIGYCSLPFNHIKPGVVSSVKIVA